MSKEILTTKEISQYVTWIFEDCMEPISEVELLVGNLPVEIQKDIKEALKSINND